MREIAAVAPSTLDAESVERQRIAFACTAHAGARADLEFSAERGDDKDAEPEREHGVGIAHAEGEKESHRSQARCDWRGEIFTQARAGGPAPGEKRAGSRQQQQRQANRDIALIEKGGADGDLLAGEGLGNQRKDRAPEHGEEHAQQNPVVEQKGVSREAKDSRRFSALSSGRRSQSRPKAKISVSTRKVAKKGPILDWAKAWTEEMMPLRVIKVPKMQSP